MTSVGAVTAAAAACALVMLLAGLPLTGARWHRAAAAVHQNRPRTRAVYGRRDLWHSDIPQSSALRSSPPETRTERQRSRPARRPGEALLGPATRVAAPSQQTVRSGGPWIFPEGVWTRRAAYRWVADEHGNALRPRPMYLRRWRGSTTTSPLKDLTLKQRSVDEPEKQNFADILSEAQSFFSSLMSRPVSSIFTADKTEDTSSSGESGKYNSGDMVAEASNVFSSFVRPPTSQNVTIDDVVSDVSKVLHDTDSSSIKPTVAVKVTKYPVQDRPKNTEKTAEPSSIKRVKTPKPNTTKTPKPNTSKPTPAPFPKTAKLHSAKPTKAVPTTNKTRPKTPETSAMKRKKTPRPSTTESSHTKISKPTEDPKFKTKTVQPAEPTATPQIRDKTTEIAVEASVQKSTKAPNQTTTKSPKRKTAKPTEAPMSKPPEAHAVDTAESQISKTTSSPTPNRSKATKRATARKTTNNPTSALTKPPTPQAAITSSAATTEQSHAKVDETSSPKTKGTSAPSTARTPTMKPAAVPALNKNKNPTTKRVKVSTVRPKPTASDTAVSSKNGTMNFQEAPSVINTTPKTGSKHKNTDAEKANIKGSFSPGITESNANKKASKPIGKPLSLLKGGEQNNVVSNTSTNTGAISSEASGKVTAPPKVTEVKYNTILATLETTTARAEITTAKKAEPNSDEVLLDTKATSLNDASQKTKVTPVKPPKKSTPSSEAKPLPMESFTGRGKPSQNQQATVTVNISDTSGVDETDAAGLRSPLNGELGLEHNLRSVELRTRTFVWNNNRLSLRVYKALVADHYNQNLVMSTQGVSTSLSMLYFGARGKTSDELHRVLLLDDMSAFNPHIGNFKFNRLLNDQDKPHTGAVCNMFLKEKIRGEVYSGFHAKLYRFYRPNINGLIHLDKAQYSIKVMVNACVKKQTEGRVSSFIEDHTALPRVEPSLATVSATYFNGTLSPHMDVLPVEMSFHASSSSTSAAVPALQLSGPMAAGYSSAADCTVAAVPFYGGQLHLVLLLPGSGRRQAADGGETQLQRLEKRMTSSLWRQVTRDVTVQDVQVTVPRISVRSDLDLRDTLHRLGIRAATNQEQANFSGVNGLLDLTLGGVLQLAEFHVSAAGSGSDLPRDSRNLWWVDNGRLPWEEPVPTNPPPPRSLERSHDLVPLVFDRPFLFAVRHNPTGAIVLLGRYAGPESEKKQ